MGNQWFDNAIRLKGKRLAVTVEGARISYQQWERDGADAKPGLLLVHGHAANSHWWDFIAPSFVDHYNVVAIDMSGNGDSDHRNTYSASQYAREIAHVAEDAGLQRPVVVGHSFGGSMARIAAHLYQRQFAGLVIVDSVLGKNRSQRAIPNMPTSRTRYYPSLEAGARRFRLRPPQPVTHPDIVAYIARQSLRQTPEGYTFKLDQAVFAKMTQPESFPDAFTMVQQLEMPKGFIYGAKSRFFPPEMVTATRELFAPGLFTRIDDAHHHVFLDQPIAFIEALARQLEVMAD